MGCRSPLIKKKSTKLLMSVSEVVCIVSLDACLDASEESVKNYTYIRSSGECRRQDCVRK
jgi:hypothetical protein